MEAFSGYHEYGTILIIEELRPEYKKKDLGKGVRGKYYKEFISGTNLVLLNLTDEQHHHGGWIGSIKCEVIFARALSPDVAAVFPNEKAVNDALRSLIKIAKNTAGQTRQLS